MTPEQFEALIRRELAERDRRRRARIGDPLVYAEADHLCVNAVMLAAGYGPPSEGEKVIRKARRARQVHEDMAFEGAP